MAKMSDTMKLAKATEKLTPNVKVVHRTIDFSDRFNKIRMYLASDWHFGTTGEILEPVQRYINSVLQDPASLLVIDGDLFNLSKEGQQRDVLSIDQIIDILVELLSPVAKQGKLLFVLSGNHDRRIMDASSVDLIKQVCKRLEKEGSNVPYIDKEHGKEEDTSALYYAAATINLKRDDVKGGKVPTYWLFHHGDGMSGVDDLKRIANIIPGFTPNGVICGHTHNPAHKTDLLSSYDPKTGEMVFTRCKSIILASVGDPTYSYAKNYGNNYKAPGIVMEIGTSKNPLYGLPHEPEILVTTTEVKDRLDLDTRIKQAYTDTAGHVIENMKATKEKTIEQGKKEIDKLARWRRSNTTKVTNSLGKVKKEKVQKADEEPVMGE